MDLIGIVTLLSGVAMFLFGMSVMGDSLKKVAGSRMEMILYNLSGNTIKGILLGTGVTAVIQSSSATSVMVVGFVNSGMMKVRQAIGVILGAILGTSITGWLLCLNSLGGTGSDIAAYFSTEMLTGVVALIGIILWMASKKSSGRNIGGILLGFAVLMNGMSMMSGAIEPLRENPSFIKMLTSFSNPVLGVLVGIAFTAVIQSASAAVGILQALAVTGAIEFDMALPILMGIGIGASVPVMLSALGADTNGKRTALVYLVIDVLGAIICGCIFYGLNALFHFPFMTLKMDMVSVALTNTLYRLATVLILAPATGILEKIVCTIFRDSEEHAAEQADMDRLETRFLSHPALALAQSRTVINSMADKAGESVHLAIRARREEDPENAEKTIKRVQELEGVLDRYEDKLGSYLFKITQSPLKKEQTAEVNKYLRVLSDFERISDHARGIGEAVAEIREKKVTFSLAAQEDLNLLENAILEITSLTITAFREDSSETAYRIDPLMDVIDALCDEIKGRHIARVGKQKCSLLNGFIFNDLLTDYERVADHCSNVAVDVLEEPVDLSRHELHKSPDYLQSDTYIRLVGEYQRKYTLADEAV